MPRVNNRPIGKYSSNLVTLLLSLFLVFWAKSFNPTEVNHCYHFALGYDVGRVTRRVCEKVAQNVAQPILLSKYRDKRLPWKKGAQKCALLLFRAGAGLKSAGLGQALHCGLRLLRAWPALGGRLGVWPAGLAQKPGPSPRGPPLPKVNNHPFGKNSPNLVTLDVGHNRERCSRSILNVIRVLLARSVVKF
jgi:hypothetical protein